MRKGCSHNSLRIPWWSWIALICLIGWNGAWAQEVVLHLHNGDRISGRILNETPASLELATAFAEKVTVLKTLIDRREIKAALSSTAASTNAPAKPAAPATGVASELTPTNKPPATAAAPQPSKPPKPSLFRRFISEWRGEAQLGANLGFSTKDRETFTGHMQLTQNHRFGNGDTGLRNILDYDVAYGTTEEVLSDNRMEGSVKTEYDLSKRFLVYNNVVAGYDEIRSIDLQYDFGPGFGYKWVVLTNFVLKTELGGDYQEQFFAQDTTTSRYSLRLSEDMWWQITPKLRWDEKAEFFPELDKVGEYRLRLETNLSYLFKENLTLSLNVVDQYDTAVPSGVSKNDLQIRSLLGIKF